MLQLIHLQKFKSYRYIISSYNLRNSNSASQIVQSTSPVVTRYLTQFVLDSVLGYGIIWEPIREPNPVPQAFVLYLLVRFPGCINPETRGFFQLNSVMISKSCLVHPRILNCTLVDTLWCLKRRITKISMRFMPVNSLGLRLPSHIIKSSLKTGLYEPLPKAQWHCPLHLSHHHHHPLKGRKPRREAERSAFPQRKKKTVPVSESRYECPIEKDLGFRLGILPFEQKEI